MSGKAKDLKGLKFSMLTVKSRVENDKSGNSQWLCVCDCGREKIVRGFSIKNKSVKSCGCLVKQKRIRGKCNYCEEINDTTKVRKTNETLCKHHYYLYRKHGTPKPETKGRGVPNELERLNDSTYRLIMYDRNGLKKSDIVTFSSKSLKNIKGKVWSLTKNGGIMYVTNNNGEYLHRIICNAKKGDIVDHINGNTLDNTLENLQIITHQQNIMKSKLSKNNNSGRTGVYKYKDKWNSKIMVDYKSIDLGIFNTFDDAVKARDEAEAKYFGKYKPINQ